MCHQKKSDIHKFTKENSLFNACKVHQIQNVNFHTQTRLYPLERGKNTPIYNLKSFVEYFKVTTVQNKKCYTTHPDSTNMYRKKVYYPNINFRQKSNS